MTARHGCASTVSLSIMKMTGKPQAISSDIREGSFDGSWRQSAASMPMTDQGAACPAGGKNEFELQQVL